MDTASLTPRASATRLFVLRHGAVDPSWHGRIYGALDVPLSPRGREEARLAARRLASVPLAAVLSSGLERAEFGAACLREGRSLAACSDPELRELERGEWAGMRIDELERKRPGAWAAWKRAPADTRPPGGESLGDLGRRILPRFRHWAERHAGQSIALVVHGWVLRVLTCHALGLGPEMAPRLDVRTGDITQFRWPLGAGARPELESFALDHVPDA